MTAFSWRAIGLLATAVLVLRIGANCPAQEQPDVAGLWEGQLHFNFLWKIDRDSDGRLSATLSMPDQKTYNVPVQNVVFTDDSLILELQLSNVAKGRFAGKYDASSRRVAGFYSDGQNAYPMTLTPGTHLLESMAPRVDDAGQKVLKYRYQVPPRMDGEWPTASLRSAGIDSSLIIQLIESILAERNKNIHSILIARNGNLVLEEYFYGCKRDKIHMIASVTKSVTGTCAGIAMDKGLISSLDQSLCSFFPEYANLICTDQKKQITLYHLLSMTAGFKWDEQTYTYLDTRNSSVAANSSGDCIKYLFERPLSDNPGERLVYNSDLPNTMGEVIRKTSGLRVDKFAEQYLFAPLHIKEYSWEVVPEGRIQAGGGLSLLPRDMLKLASLYMNEGEYLGQRVVSRAWLQRCSDRLRESGGPEYWNHWGPNLYRINDRLIEVFSGAGLGGQWLFGVPALNLVVVFTADYFGATESGPAMMEHYILPAVVTPAFVRAHPDFGIKIKELRGLKYEPRNLALLGCIKGALNFLHEPVSDDWLYGATGYTFLINMHEKIYSYSVGAWDKERFYELGKNIGFTTGHLHGDKASGSFELHQQKAWEAVRQAIDQGYPCYGFPLHTIPDIHLITGYDQCGYYIRGVGCESGAGPVPWRELGQTNGNFDLHILRPCKPSPPHKTIKDALSFAVEFAAEPNRWIGPEYKAGPAAYDQWIKALDEGTADPFGSAFTPLVWAECRSHAAPFLIQAKAYLPAELHPLCDEAIRHYRVAAENLQKVSALFPFFPMLAQVREANIKDKEKCAQAISCLRAAQMAEEAGLVELRRIVAGL